MVNVSKRTYGNYSNNYGAHCIEISVGTLTLYFSYDTVVAFSDDFGLVISENNWGSTTGKHLNAISENKKLRIPRADFEAKLDEVLKKHDLSI